MQIAGKILGTLFGSFLGLPGAIIGFYIGHRFDKAKAQGNFTFATSTFGGASQSDRQGEFFKAAFSVMGHVAKSKGQVTREEIQLASVMMERMKLNDEQRQMAQDAFRDGKASDFPLDDVLQGLRQSTGGRHDLIQFFLELQISSAFADGSLHPNEREVLHRIARSLGFSAEQLERRLRMQEAAFRFQRQGGFAGGEQGGQDSSGQWRSTTSSADQLADAYSILGIEASADGKEVKRAYRKLMNEHHPDKLMAKGLPPEMMTVATEKSQEIQKAYDLIKNAKGFK
jgi:DnaJ like chaperone protein